MKTKSLKTDNLVHVPEPELMTIGNSSTKGEDTIS